MVKNINGLNINYTCEGEGDLVLLLHGWGANIKLFESTISLLRGKYKVVALDMPGFGESDEPEEPWCVDNYVDFVLEFLKEFEFEKIILLGHSFGGRVIIKLCSRDNPFTVEKVILVDSAGVKPKTRLSQKIKSFIYKMTKWIFALPIVIKLFPNLLDTLKKRSGSADYNAASPVMKQTLVKVVNEDLCELMPNIKCSTLLIWGKNDTATPLSDGKTMERLMPESALVEIDNAGHFSFLDQQNLYLRILSSFLNID